MAGQARMKPEIAPGKIAISKKGRDKGRYFVILLSLDADFVMVSDGDTRKLNHLKKKRRKHLCALPAEVPELLNAYQAGTLQDAMIRKALQPYKTQADSGRDVSFVQG